MMAKMFYTLEEAKAALGKSEEEIKQYAREGKLREFRDGPRLMFKADQVEQLKGGADGGGMGGDDAQGLDQVDLGVSDSGGLIGLVDTTGASGTSISMSDAEGEIGGSGLGSGLSGSGLGSGLAGSGLGSGLSGSGLSSNLTSSASGIGSSNAGMTMKMKDDTALATDLGLSGSLGGVPSPGRPGGPSGSGLSGSAGGSGRGSGINVFGTDDGGEFVDPMAQTNISGGIRDQLSLEGVGSGSGLLDLTRESDDTSLGAVLDEITPGAGPMSGRRQPAIDVGEGSLGSVLDDEMPTAPRVAAPPMVVQAADPLAPAFGGAALAAAGVMVFASFILIAAVLGSRPNILKWFVDNKINFLTSSGIGLIAVVVFFVIGLIIGRVGSTAKR